MSVAKFLSPKVLDPPLRSTEASVDQEGVGIGGDLRRDPGGESHQSCRQRLPEPEYPLEARKRYLHLLPLATLPGALGHQRSRPPQNLFERLAPVGQVPKEPANEILLKACCLQQLLCQPYLGDVGSGQFIAKGTLLVERVSWFPAWWRISSCSRNG